jgi:predicted ATPase
MPGLAEANRNAALDALLRSDARVAILLDVVEGGKVDPEQLGPARAEKLRKHANEKLAKRAAEVLKPQ